MAQREDLEVQRGTLSYEASEQPQNGNHHADHYDQSLSVSAGAVVGMVMQCGDGCDPGGKKRYACEASAHLTPIAGQAPANAQGSVVKATGYGPTEGVARQAALSLVGQNVPYGFYVRHKHVLRCWRV
jgi:hypothetical protein